MKLLNKSELTKEVFNSLPLWDYANVHEAEALFSVDVDEVTWNIVTVDDVLYKSSPVKMKMRRADYDNVQSMPIKLRNGSTVSHGRHERAYEILIDSTVVYSNKNHAMAKEFLRRAKSVIHLCKLNPEQYLNV